MKQNQKFGIAIHGGGGRIVKSEKREKYREIMMKCIDKLLREGRKMLQKGKTSLEVCEHVVSLMEDSGMFNCGKGSVKIKGNLVQMDATIMEGENLAIGSVCAVPRIKNAIRLAKTGGSSNFVFVKKKKLDIVNKEYFDRLENVESINKSEKLKSWHNQFVEEHDTVGCVCLDIQGNVSAATSTGGLSGKIVGRVGDSGIVGAGTYANNNTCAVSCTGIGELIIKYMIAHDLHCRIKYKNQELKIAAMELINDMEDGVGGFVAIDRNCNISMNYNSLGMYRGKFAFDDDVPSLYIWEEEHKSN